MNILGVGNAIDSGAVLIQDSVVVAAVSEERFTREKLTSKFPINSIKYVLKEGNITIEDIDWCGCGSWRGIDTKQTLPALIDEIIYLVKKDPLSEKIIKERIQASLSGDSHFRKELLLGIKNLGIPNSKIILYDYHFSHACLSFYPSPFKEALVLVASGRGDFRSTTLWEANKNEGLSLISQTSELSSLGSMYGSITKLLGFTPNRHEGKVTGLAAKGNPSVIHERLMDSIGFNKELGRINAKIGDFYKPFNNSTPDGLVEKIGKLNKENFAFAAQDVLERSLVDLVSHYLSDKPNSSINLCLAGGCIGNVKLNLELKKIPQIKNVYIVPSMGDGGNALAGAICATTEKSISKAIKLNNASLGPQYNNAQIESTLINSKIRYSRISGNAKIMKTAQLINEGKIIGWFQGRMEYGPRALGNRSILASADNPQINMSLNSRLERSEFMPFAPVTTTLLAPKCFIDWKESDNCTDFMNMCYECTEFMSLKCPATVHVDNTARPQVIKEKNNPEYFRLIMKYYEISSRPALINTSFNHHEEPIVMTPLDAIRSFEKRNVDVLIIGDFIAIYD